MADTSLTRTRSIMVTEDEAETKFRGIEVDVAKNSATARAYHTLSEMATHVNMAKSHVLKVQYYSRRFQRMISKYKKQNKPNIRTVADRCGEHHVTAEQQAILD
jgi:hypothetical protein